jgi:pimeloyl-ACP methyl ester carboxylesterase
MVKKQTAARKVGWGMGIIFSLFVAIIFIFVAVLFYWSHPGKPAPYLDANGKPLPNSISEKIYVEINGVKMGMFIKSKDRSHPVMLYLHGGMPDYFLNQQYPTGLEDDFTMVWWEQRGAGMTFSDSTPTATMNLEQMIADTIEVTNYLRERFGKDKIYLMGHSGGTFIAIQTAARAPELYYAYIGVAQMADQLESEQLTYNYMLEEYQKLGDTGMVRKLEATPVTAEGVPPDYQMVRDNAMHGLGIGTMHNMRSILTGLVIPSFQNRDYTLGEKITFWRAKAKSGISSLWNTVTLTDLNQEIQELPIPVYFFEGIYDYTCAYSVAKEYFEHLKAPVKGFYTFDKSAHSPIFEESGKVQRIMREDVLNGTSKLADAQSAAR